MYNPADTPRYPRSTSSTSTPDYRIAATSDDMVVVTGWSVKAHLLGKSVYNEQDDKIGDIRDVVLGAQGQATHYVIGVGGFLGIGEHDVAIPFNLLSPKNLAADKDDTDFILKGHTKEELKTLPKVSVLD